MASKKDDNEIVVSKDITLNELLSNPNKHTDVVEAVEDQGFAKVKSKAYRALGSQGGVFKLGDTEFGNSIDCVIGGLYYNREYRTSAYDPNDKKPPSCFAFGENPKELAPHANAQLPEATSCEDCPHAKWGANRKPPACKERFKLAVFPFNSEGNVVSEEDLVLMSVPPTGLKWLKKQVLEPIQKSKTHIKQWWGNVTLIQEKSYFRPNFSWGKLIPATEFEKINTELVNDNIIEALKQPPLDDNLPSAISDERSDL